MSEELAVVFHAAQLGRTDIIQSVLTSLRSAKQSDEEIAKLISTGRAEDNATPLHLAAHFGFADVIRALLVT